MFSNRLHEQENGRLLRRTFSKAHEVHAPDHCYSSVSILHATAADAYQFEKQPSHADAQDDPEAKEEIDTTINGFCELASGSTCPEPLLKESAVLAS